MSVELLLQDHNQERFLRDDEKALLCALLSNRPDFYRLIEEISRSRVIDMSDGGMGSIKFISPDGRTLGVTLVEAHYSDIDGVPVSITVNADDQGRLYEMDFWKVDFSPLKLFPRPEFVKIKCR
jgi:hypothetical protein